MLEIVQLKGPWLMSPPHSLQPGQAKTPSPAPLTSRSQSSGERAPRWGSLALSSSWVRRARGSCCVVNGCWRMGGAQVGLWPPGPLSSMEPLPPPPAPAPPPTCRSFSAVGLFLGFLVKASLRKWWKFWVLVGTRAPRPTSALRQGILPTAPCCHSRGVCWACPRKGQPEARAAGLSNTAVATWKLPHQQPPSTPAIAPRCAPGPPKDGLQNTRGQGSGGCTLRVGRWLLCSPED